MNDDYGCISIIGMLVVIFLITGLAGNINKVEVDAAVTRFTELAEVSPSEIEVIVHSNNNQWLLGDPHDVTFELKISGKPTSGRCTSALTSPMVCRLYSGGE